MGDKYTVAYCWLIKYQTAETGKCFVGCFLYLVGGYLLYVVVYLINGVHLSKGHKSFSHALHLAQCRFGVYGHLGYKLLLGGVELCGRQLLVFQQIYLVGYKHAYAVFKLYIHGGVDIKNTRVAHGVVLRFDVVTQAILLSYAHIQPRV